MKKIVSLFLVVVIFISVLPMAVAQGRSPLLFASCDMAVNWVNGSYPATNHRIDYENFTQGIGSVMYDGDLSKGNAWIAYTHFQDAADISAYTHLEFDFYVDDISLLKNAVGQIELTSSKACDIAELGFTEGHYKSQIKQSGWNHIVLPLKRGVLHSQDANRPFDATALDFFRFYLMNLESPKGTYTLGLDNIYFSDGVTKPDDTIPKSTYTPTAPCKENGYRYGDLNEDANINAVDALECLKYSVDKTHFTNKMFAMGDVNASGKIDALDALEILKISVKKLDQFSVQTKEILPETVEVGVNGAHLVHTKYPTDSRVIAVTDVIHWGAMGDGVTDDTNAFRMALAYAQSVGGGTVFVPEGKYVIKGTLVIPNGVTLQGDSPKVSVDEEVKGTVLMAYNGRGKTDGFAFLNMDSASAIANLSVFYPEQTMGDITPYPFTIRQVGHYGIGITNVRLVNSYQGICMGPSTNSLQNIRGVVGTPLKMGLILDHNVDICRIENVTFSPDCWINSGLSSAKDHYYLTRYLYENATAFQFERVDWTYIADIAAKGYHTAFRTCKPTMREAEESANGHVYGLNFEECYIGIDANYVNVIGMMFTNGKISGEIPLRTSSEFTAEISLNRIDMQTKKETAVVIEGDGVVSLEHCTLSSEKTGVLLQEGQLLCNQVIFETPQNRVVANAGTKATLTNCQSKLSLDAEASKGTVIHQTNEEFTTAQFDPEKYDYNQQVVTRPAGDRFVDITKEPYLADTTCTKNIGELLQQALNDVGEFGGVVYVPAGKYRLDTPITVPTGVELRGSATVPQHSHALSTTFFTNYGKGADETAQALISLSPASGVQGFKVFYDEQPGGMYDCQPYAFTLRGQGNNNYVKNVNFINSFYQMDFATNRCDGHYVNGATGYPLEQGVVVGGGSVNGIVRDCQFNVHYFCDNPHYKTLDVAMEDAMGYAMEYSEAFVVKQTTNQMMFHNFVLGVHSGIAIDEGADVFVLAHGTDVGDRSITVRGTPSGEVVFVNTQLVAYKPGKTRAYINIEPSFTGRVDMTQTNFWGDPAECSVLVGGGELYLSQGNNVRSGELGVKVWNNARCSYNSIHHLRNDTRYDLYLSDAGNVISYGNLYASGGILFDGASSYKGNEF